MTDKKTDKLTMYLGEVVTKKDYYWTKYSDYKLSGDIKSYKTLALAMTACTSNAKCMGVTTHVRD